MIGLAIKKRKTPRGTAVALCLAGALLQYASAGLAQQLSIHHYGTSDGLAQNSVRCIHQDAKGYLWFGTGEGVSRFDGYRFTNYGAADGLTNLFINAIVEDRLGRIWIGTNGSGVSRLIDDPTEVVALHKSEAAANSKQKFLRFRVSESQQSNQVNAMLFDQDDNLWCATDDGLYRAAANPNDALKFEIIVPHQPVTESMTAFVDSHGRLWFGIVNELIEIAHGRIIKYGPADGVGRTQIRSIVEDQQGRLLVANQHEIFEFVGLTDSMSGGRWKRFPLTFGQDQYVGPMVADSLGALWIGTSTGLIKAKDGKETLYTSAQGLSNNSVSALEGDGDGNLWIGSYSDGVGKLSGEMILSYLKTEGLPDQAIVRVVPTSSGRVYVSTGNAGFAEILERHAVAVQGSQSPPFNDARERILQDSRSDWWIGTGRGLFRFQGPALQVSSGRKFTTADGISDASDAGIAEDWSGRVWIGSWDRNLYRYDPARRNGVLFERLPLGTMSSSEAVLFMMSGRSGDLWLGKHGMLGRLSNEKVIAFEPTEGLPETDPRAFFQDSRGWLWIGLRNRGVSMTKDPTAAQPRFINYSTRNGLASDAVWSITEDDFGRMYFGTSKGLDRLDLSSGRVRQFTTADGLAGDTINHCVRDSQGNIWVATASGLSKLNPQAERVANRLPPIFLSRVQIAGEDIALPETGATVMAAFELSASRNNFLIEYVGLDFVGERELKYQYKLDGVDIDWSTPTEQRSVNYARLAPGSYRFLVRAINQEGIASPEPAVIQFRILPPIWQRWWFLALVAIALIASTVALYRYRVGQILALERIRRQIAIDLHDDMGSGLSQVALLSEVATREAAPAVAVRLNEIAKLARSMRDSMSDIVWAVDPRKDRVADLIQRMKQASFNLLEPDDLRVEFYVPEDRLIEQLGLAPDRRRHLLLIFKEAMTNVARHARASYVYVEIKVTDSALKLTIQDDGCGFNPQDEHDGHGLRSLKQRASELRARIRLDSSPGHGTTVQLVVPLK